MNVEGKRKEHRAWGPERTRAEAAAEPLAVQAAVTGYVLQ